jgi:hypothetical protein
VYHCPHARGRRGGGSSGGHEVGLWLRGEGCEGEYRGLEVRDVLLQEMFPGGLARGHGGGGRALVI